MKKYLALIILSILISSICYAANTYVIFNVNSKKFHKPDCTWAIACTRNCIKVDKKTAIENGGVPCKVCGG